MASDLTEVLIAKRQLNWKGIACVAALVISWVGQSEVCQLVQVNGYNKPMAITWLNHVSGIVVLPCFWLCTGGSLHKCWHALTSRISPATFLAYALGLSAVYMLADWFWYIGLPFTSVAAGTAIFNAQPIFVCGLSAALGLPITGKQVLAILVSAVGVLTISCKPGDNLASGVSEAPANQLLGNLFVLLASAGYAVYDVLLDRVIVSSELLVTSAYVSLSGLLTFFCLWPVLLCLATPGLPEAIAEVPEFPPKTAVAGLMTNAVLATTFNVTFALSIVTTSPLITSVACILTIPTSLAVDTLVHGDHFGLLEMSGSVFITAGFILVLIDKASAA